VNVPGQVNQNSVADVPFATDQDMAEGLQLRMSEAAERVTFHSIELERWQRIGRASAAALEHLSEPAPVMKWSAEDFLSAREGRPVEGPRAA
jgi:hypothetical protein